MTGSCRHSKGHGGSDSFSVPNNGDSGKLDYVATAASTLSELNTNATTTNTVAPFSPAPSIQNAHDPLSHTNGNTLSPHLPATPVTSSTTPVNSIVGKTDETVPKAEYERLKLEMRLREADNNFLQEELENKDKMLHLLTAGLKEVSHFDVLYVMSCLQIVVGLGGRCSKAMVIY